MGVSELQLLNKVLQDKDYSVVIDNNITEEYFTQAKSEFSFLHNFYKEYDSVPDTQTFISEFPEWELFKVEQPVKSIVDNLRENLVFRRAVELVNKSSKMFEEDANVGAKYLAEHIQDLLVEDGVEAVDILNDRERYEKWEEKKNDPSIASVEMPLKELNEVTGGFKREEELFMILAKTNVGKSQFLAICAEHASKMGETVGIISPEMSVTSMGYRIDTAKSHLSNTAMNRGYMLNGYKEYTDSMGENCGKIYVADTTMFKSNITVADCEAMIRKYKLTALFIDGISYIKPSKNFRGTANESMGETCKGLLSLSTKYKLPVVGVIQARRRGSENRDIDEISDSESVYNSHFTAQVASSMMSINRCQEGLKFIMVKSRTGKIGEETEKVYNVDFDRLVFNYVPSEEDVEEDEDLATTKESLKHNF